ncbi:MAG: hypothetical protein IT443_06610 [Phycisphaeraceae bacterium]|nr:hypothetical protein [Phycisphaeraceae bacterium]
MAITNPRVWRRNQMEAALWRYAVTLRHWGGDPDHLAGRVPQVFRSRIKKMLNMDRDASLTPWKDLDDKWAFYDQPGAGTGSEERFSNVHVFMMSLALDLLDIGLKQSEVIFFLKHTRPALQAAYDQIHRRTGCIAPVSGSSRQRRLARHYTASEPIRLGSDTAQMADFTAWLVIRREENEKAYPGFRRKVGKVDIPLFMKPKLFFGLEAVKEEIFLHLSGYPHAMVIEIADRALTLEQYLAYTPAIGRGRSANK